MLLGYTQTRQKRIATLKKTAKNLVPGKQKTNHPHKASAPIAFAQTRPHATVLRERQDVQSCCYARAENEKRSGFGRHGARGVHTDIHTQNRGFVADASRNPCSLTSLVLLSSTSQVAFDGSVKPSTQLGLSSDLFPPQTQGGIFPRNPQGSFCGRKQSQKCITKSPPFRVSVWFGWKRNFSIRANFSWSPKSPRLALMYSAPTTSGAAPAPPHHRFDQACVRWS